MKQAKITVCMLTILYGVLVLFALLKPSEETSVSERRKLAQRPELSLKAITSGSFMTGTEEYVTDQFPFREGFRAIKSVFSLGVLGNQDTNGIYYKDGHLCEMEYPMNEDSIERASGIFRQLQDTYFEGTDVKAYLCLIPDKNYVLAKEEHLAFDYDVFLQKTEESNDFLTPISIKEEIQLSDFYRTDTHWKQEEITDIAKKIAGEMGVTLSGEYDIVTIEPPFYGVYYGQAALPVEPDVIRYCTNDILETCAVYDHENNKEIKLYDEAKSTDRDPYEMFLGGNVSLVTVENPAAATEKELVVFGDSFSRSIIPFLAEGYSKITLVDIRYLPSAYVGSHIEFDKQDVLFLYSTSVINNSITLK